MGRIHMLRKSRDWRLRILDVVFWNQSLHRKQQSFSFPPNKQTKDWKRQSMWSKQWIPVCQGWKSEVKYKFLLHLFLFLRIEWESKLSISEPRNESFFSFLSKQRSLSPKIFLASIFSSEDQKENLSSTEDSYFK